MDSNEIPFGKKYKRVVCDYTMRGTLCEGAGQTFRNVVLHYASRVEALKGWTPELVGVARFSYPGAMDYSLSGVQGPERTMYGLLDVDAVHEVEEDTQDVEAPTKRTTLADFRHLEDAEPLSSDEMREILAKLPQSYWDGVAQMMADNARKFEAARKSITPTYEDMHRRFDL